MLLPLSLCVAAPQALRFDARGRQLPTTPALLPHLFMLVVLAAVAEVFCASPALAGYARPAPRGSVSSASRLRQCAFSNTDSTNGSGWSFSCTVSSVTSASSVSFSQLGQSPLSVCICQHTYSSDSSGWTVSA